MNRQSIIYIKNNIYIIICLSAFLFNGCTIQEADVFPDPPVERLNKALKDIDALLQNSQSGWAMEYFATTQSPGYNLLIKFKSNGQAVVAAKNEMTKYTILSDSSVYELIGDNGPVLTFNSYNKVLHSFSNPVNPNGFGLEGDYEFVVMKTSVDKIELQGKKRGTTILLTRIPQNISFNQYFSELDVMNSLLFGGKSQALKMVTANTNYTFSNGGNHIFEILKEGADVNTSITTPFIVTRFGIRLYSVWQIGGDTVQTFILNTDQSALVSTRDSSIKLVGPDSLTTFFAKNPNLFTFDSSKMSSSVKTIYELLVQSIIKTYKAEKVWLSIQYQPVQNVFYLTLNFKIGNNKFPGSLQMNLTTNGKEEVTLAYSKPVDNNGNKFYKLVEFKNMVTMLSSEFIISTDAPINPQHIKFQQKSNAEINFTISTDI